mmetsp:Transcript_17417/g.40055  ORF Transcript_17417/g.40055 Transcript_17417/m.40055 type:complete len:726 (+) Transcript_17417:2184-4361(+)
MRLDPRCSLVRLGENVFVVLVRLQRGHHPRVRHLVEAFSAAARGGGLAAPAALVLDFDPGLLEVLEGVVLAPRDELHALHALDRPLGDTVVDVHPGPAEVHCVLHHLLEQGDELLDVDRLVPVLVRLFKVPLETVVAQVVDPGQGAAADELGLGGRRLGLGRVPVAALGEELHEGEELGLVERPLRQGLLLRPRAEPEHVPSSPGPRGDRGHVPRNPGRRGCRGGRKDNHRFLPLVSHQSPEPVRIGRLRTRGHPGQIFHVAVPAALKVLVAVVVVAVALPLPRVLRLPPVLGLADEHRLGELVPQLLVEVTAAVDHQFALLPDLGELGLVVQEGVLQEAQPRLLREHVVQKLHHLRDQPDLQGGRVAPRREVGEARHGGHLDEAPQALGLERDLGVRDDDHRLHQEVHQHFARARLEELGHRRVPHPGRVLARLLLGLLGGELFGPCCKQPRLGFFGLFFDPKLPPLLGLPLPLLGLFLGLLFFLFLDELDALVQLGLDEGNPGRAHAVQAHPGVGLELEPRVRVAALHQRVNELHQAGRVLQCLGLRARRVVPVVPGKGQLFVRPGGACRHLVEAVLEALDEVRVDPGAQDLAGDGDLLPLQRLVLGLGKHKEEVDLPRFAHVGQLVHQVHEELHKLGTDLAFDEALVPAEDGEDELLRQPRQGVSVFTLGGPEALGVLACVLQGEVARRQHLELVEVLRHDALVLPVLRDELDGQGEQRRVH